MFRVGRYHFEKEGATTVIRHRFVLGHEVVKLMLISVLRHVVVHDRGGGPLHDAVFVTCRAKVVEEIEYGAGVFSAEGTDISALYMKLFFILYRALEI